MLNGFGGWHLLAILIIVVLLFGAPKLPALARSIGQSMRIFQSEIKTKDPKTDDGEPVAATGEPTVTTTRVASSDSSDSSTKS